MATSFPGAAVAEGAPRRAGRTVANRLARRDIRAHKGRSLLVVLLVALPLVLLTAVGSVLIGSYHQVPQLTTDMNTATSKVVALAGANGSCHQADPTQASCPGVEADATPATLPSVPDLGPDQSPLTQSTRTVPLRWKDADFDVSVLATSFTDSRLADLFDARGVPLPRRDQVAVNARLAQRFGTTVGDRIRLAGHDYTVSAVVRMEGWVDTVLVGSDHPLAARPQVVFGYGPVPGAADIARLNEQGFAVLTREAVGTTYGTVDGAAMEQVIIVLGGLFVSILTATVAAAAFAISIRQQRRTLALLGATGASSSTLQRVVVHNGLVLGLAGATSGVLTGLALGWWWHDRTDRTSLVMPAPFEVPWFMLVGLWCLGVAAATIAAWIPARQVVGQDVLTAVRSADQASTPARVSRVGIGAAAVGLVVGLFGALTGGPGQDQRLAVEDAVIPAALSCVLLFLGMLLNTGWLLGVLGRRSNGPLAVRMALRDGSRNRGRATASVAASLAATSLACAVLVANASVGRTSVAEYQPSMRVGIATLQTQDMQEHAYSSATMAKQVAAVRSVMGRADAVALQSPRECFAGSCTPVSLEQTCPNGGCVYASNSNLVVGTPQVARVLLGDVPDGVSQALADGKVVVTDPRLVQDQMVTWTPICAGGDCSAVQPVKIPAFLVDGPPAQPMISAQAAARHKLGALMSAGWAVDMGRAPTQAEADQVTAALQRDAGVVDSFAYERGAVDGYAPATTWFGRVALALLLAIAAVTTMLTLGDAGSARASLAAIGARSRTLRGMAATQTLVTVGLGGLLGLVVGAVPMVAVVSAVPGMKLGVPWGWIAACVLGVPLVAAALTWLLARPPAPRAGRID